jgi:trans-aconitate methyltransferase
MAEAPPTLEKVKPWAFDDEVARRFQQEAKTHIPDYERVISMCVDIVNYNFPEKDAKIIDIGSALGFTVDKFLQAGYQQVHGLEISDSMKNNSLHKDRIIISDKMPNEHYNVVLANWTLHFILERREYLTDIFNSLSPNGLLILSDKMSQPWPMKELYYNWKRANGVSQETIFAKEQKLKGVLETKPLSWYLEILEKIGFREVECINSRFGFNTLICKKF